MRANMSEQTPKITITIEGDTNVGKTSMCWLLSDFLQHSGFDVDLWSLDLDPEDEDKFVEVVKSVPSRLNTILEKNTKIIIKDASA